MSTRISTLQKVPFARRIGRCVCAALVVLFAAAPVTSHAFHFPWDQGHDTTDWDDPPDDGPCEGPQCDPCSSTGSPVYIPTGHFIWTETDVSIAGQPALSLTRTYNSNDPRDGLFGRGWTTNCDAALLQYAGSEVDATNGVVQVSGYVLRSSDGKRYTFRRSTSGAIVAPSGRFERIVPQANGGVRVFGRTGSSRTYSSAGRLMSASSPAGHVLSYSYDAAGRLQRITNPAGRFLSFAYNSRGRVEAVSDSANRTWRYAYDANGNLISVTNPAGGIRSFEYRGYTPVGSAHTYYQLARITDETGVVVTDVAYNGERVASYTEGQNRFSYAYNTTTRTVTKTDSLNSQWVYTYSDAGKVTSIRDPLGNIERFEFDANGNVTRYVDQLSHAWERTYDALGRTLTITTPLGETTTFEYEGELPLPVRTTSPSGRVTEAAYTATGNIAEVVDAAQQRTSLSYDAAANLREIRNAMGAVTTLASDASGLPLSIRDPLARTSLMQYDGAGKLVSLTDPEGNVRSLEYDVWGLPSVIVDPLGGRTRFVRDAAARLTTLIDPAGNLTQYEYDAFGRVSARVMSDGRRYEFRYRADNLLSQMVRADGIVETYAYDSAKRMTSKSAGGATVAFAYDARGKLTGASNEHGSSTLTYDAAGRWTSEQSNGLDIAYSYNMEGERTEIRSIVGTTSLSRNSRGLVEAIQSPQGEFSLSYDALMRRTQLSYPNGTTADYEYDVADQLVEIESTGAFAEGLRFEYGAAGLLTRSSSNSATLAYDYDDAGRLTAVNGATPELFAYDAANNLTGNGREYDSANRLTRDDVHDYQYNANGSLILKTERASGARTVYSWDAWNRLQSVAQYADGTSTEPVETLEFTYDAFDRRLSRRRNGITERFAYDGVDLIATIDSQGAIQQSIVHGTKIDEPLGVLDAQGQRYLHANQVGSIIGVSGAGGALDRYQYRAYGSSIGSAPQLAAGFGFTAREFENQDLYYYRARYYDPSIGRFISEDPIQVLGGLNLYAYVEGDPVNQVDPTGEFGIPGAIFGAGMDLAFQMLVEGKSLKCVNWAQVGVAGALGAVGGGVLGGAFKMSKGSMKAANAVRRYRRAHNVPRTHDVHHWAVEKGGWLGKRLPDGVVNHPANLNPIDRGIHQRLHHEMNAAERWWHGTPDWAKAAEGSLAGGLIAEGVDGECGCE